MGKLDELIERYGEGELLIADDLDDAIIGVVNDFNSPPRVAYSTTKVIEILMKSYDMDYTEAIEYFSFNVSGAYVGEKTPIWVDDEFEE